MAMIDAHTLHADFPHFRDRIRQLLSSDPEFCIACDEYHQLDKKIRGLEASGIATDDGHFTWLKHRRVQMKDALYRRLCQEEAGTEA